ADGPVAPGHSAGPGQAVPARCEPAAVDAAAAGAVQAPGRGHPAHRGCRGGAPAGGGEHPRAAAVDPAGGAGAAAGAASGGGGGVGPMGGRRGAMGAARLWADTCWRGGLGGFTVFDEVLDAPLLVRALNAGNEETGERGFDAGLLVGCDWCLVDPELCDAVIE